MPATRVVTGSPPEIFWDAASSSGYEAALSTYSWNHTVSGTNRLLIVGVSVFAVGTVTGVTYNGVALTHISACDGTNGLYHTEIWYLIAPATGTHSVVVTLSTSLTSIASAVSYVGVHQTSPTEASSINQGTGTPATDAVTTIADRDVVIDCVSTSDASITVHAGQAQRANNTGALGSGAMSDSGLLAPTTMKTMQWDAIGVLDTWVQSAVALRPYTASDPTVVLSVVAGVASLLNVDVAAPATVVLGAIAGIASLTNVTVTAPFTSLVSQPVSGTASLSNLIVGTPLLTLQAVSGIATLPNLEVAAPAPVLLGAIAGVASLPNVTITSPFTPAVLQMVSGVASLPNVVLGTPLLNLGAIAGSALVANLDVAVPAPLAVQAIAGAASLPNVTVGSSQVTLQAASGIASVANVTVTASFSVLVCQSVFGVAVLSNLDVSAPAPVVPSVVLGVASLINVDVAAPATVILNLVLGVALLPSVTVGTPALSLQPIFGTATLSLSIAAPAILNPQSIVGAANLPNVPITATFAPLILQSVVGGASLPIIPIGPFLLVLDNVVGAAFLVNVVVGTPRLSLDQVTGTAIVGEVTVVILTIVLTTLPPCEDLNAITKEPQTLVASRFIESSQEVSSPSGFVGSGDPVLTPSGYVRKIS
jgi:hypothetical protein